MNLTWNYKNEVGCGAFEQFDSGISQFGQNVIKEMNALNMIIDISHLGELSFWKAINYSQKPVVASHSNVKKLCNHVRNLSDDQMRAIAQIMG
jgi:membrane dipeptidase